MQNDSEQRLSQIKQRCQSASPAPWSNSLGGGYHVHGVGGKWICVTDNKEWNSHGTISSNRREQAISNADFIAHAREDIEWLLAERERLLTQHAEI